MNKTPKQYAAFVAAAALLMAPCGLLPVILPGLLHMHTLRLLGGCAVSFIFTMPIFMRAWRYFHEEPRRDS